MKAVFFGTPGTAVPFLNFLQKNLEVAAVITRPDQPADRGQKVQKSPVKINAEKNNLNIFQPIDLKDSEFLSQIQNLKAECALVVAYGRILPKPLLEIFPKGVFNIHFSLLPRLRGAAPMQWAILNGDSKTGVTLFRISETLDTGHIVHQKEISMEPQETAFTLEEKLIPLGLEVLKESLPQIDSGRLKEHVQNGAPSYAPLLKKEDAKIRWEKNAKELERQIRALIRLGAYCRLPSGKFLKILRAEAQEKDIPSAKNVQAGAVAEIVRGRGFLVECERGQLLVLKVQMEGKKAMDAWTFLHGNPLKIGDRIL